MPFSIVHIKDLPVEILTTMHLQCVILPLVECQCLCARCVGLLSTWCGGTLNREFYRVLRRMQDCMVNVLGLCMSSPGMRERQIESGASCRFFSGVKLVIRPHTEHDWCVVE